MVNAHTFFLLLPFLKSFYFRWIALNPHSTGVSSASLNAALAAASSQSYLKSDPEGACLSALVCPSPSCKRTMPSHSPAERLCNVLSKPIYFLHVAPSLHHEGTVGVVGSELHVPDDNCVEILFFHSVLHEIRLIRCRFLCDLLHNK